MFLTTLKMHQATYDDANHVNEIKHQDNKTTVVQFLAAAASATMQELEKTSDELLGAFRGK